MKVKVEVEVDVDATDSDNKPLDSFSKDEIEAAVRQAIDNAIRFCELKDGHSHVLSDDISILLESVNVKE